MGFMKDLDEYTTEQLANEILTRVSRWANDKCPYCEHALKREGDVVTCGCKFGGYLGTYHNPRILAWFQTHDTQ